MIQDYELIFEDFSRRFNSRLNVHDFVEYLPALSEKTKTNAMKGKEVFIVLPCDNKEIFEKLNDFNYIHLLNKLVKNIDILPHCMDIFLSELPENLIDMYINYIELAKKDVVIIANNENMRFEVFSQELFIDLILSPLSQFHTEVTMQLEHFCDNINVLKQFHKNPTNALFLNSKSPTPFSYFVLAFVAEGLKIKLKI